MSNLLFPTRARSHRTLPGNFAAWTARRWQGGRYRTTAPPLPQRTNPLLVVQRTSQIGTGIVPAFKEAGAAGDSFVNTSNAVLQVINNGVVPITVKVIAQQVCNQGYLHDYVQIVAASGQRVEVGPFDFHYNDQSAVVHVTYTSIFGVTVAVTAP